MTKTKRILTILMMAILSVMVALTFTACGGDDNDDNGGSTANTKVTEAQFNASLTLTDTNFKFVMQGEEHSNEENETYTGSTTIIRSGDKVKCVYTDSDSPYATENYIEKVGEEYFVYAKFQVGGEWQKAPGSQNQFEASYAQAQPSRYLTGMSVTYDMLTYDASTKLYTYSMTEGNASGTIKVGFADGKIVSIYIRFSESGATGGYEEMNITYTYGGQSVTIPNVGGDNSGDNSGDTPATPGETVYTVTDAQFATAISPATYTAFKVSGSNTLKVNGVVDPEQSTNLTYVVSEEGMYIEVDGNESYFEVGDGAYYMYGKSGDEWMKISAPENTYQQAVSQILSNASPASYFVMFELTDLSMLNYNDTEKCYVFSPEGEEGITSTMKFFFENGKIVKVEMIAFNAELQEEITSIMNYSYAAADLTIQFPNASTGGNSGVDKPQDCQLIPTEFFDEYQVFPKSYRCTCGDASHNVTNTSIKITHAEEFLALVSMLNEEANIGTLTIEIQNDIDLGGATIPALKAYDYQYRGRVFTLAGVDGGVTISNFTVVADQEYLAAGLFGCVTGDLTIKNITLSNMTINENDEVVAGAFVGLYMPAGDEEAAAGLRIENCSVVNSSITAGCVGGIYGLAFSELSDVRLIWVDGVKVQNCGLTGIVFAGGLMGIGAQGLEKEMISVSMNDYTLLGNTITSSVDNQAGLYIGMFGNAKIVFEYSTVGNEDKINGNTVTANDVANDTRDYGRTGWASEADATYVWVGTSPMINNYSQGVH